MPQIEGWHILLFLGIINVISCHIISLICPIKSHILSHFFITMICHLKNHFFSIIFTDFQLCSCICSWCSQHVNTHCPWYFPWFTMIFYVFFTFSTCFPHQRPLFCPPFFPEHFTAKRSPCHRRRRRWRSFARCFESSKGCASEAWWWVWISWAYYYNSGFNSGLIFQD